MPDKWLSTGSDEEARERVGEFWTDAPARPCVPQLVLGLQVHPVPGVVNRQLPVRPGSRLSAMAVAPTRPSPGRIGSCASPPLPAARRTRQDRGEIGQYRGIGWRPRDDRWSATSRGRDGGRRWAGATVGQSAWGRYASTSASQASAIVLVAAGFALEFGPMAAATPGTRFLARD